MRLLKWAFMASGRRMDGQRYKIWTGTGTASVCFTVDISELATLEIPIRFEHDLAGCRGFNDNKSRFV